MDNVFPLNYVEFLGVPGLGAPRNIVSLIKASSGPEVLEDCVTQHYDHKKGGLVKGPKHTFPCEKLNEYLELKRIWKWTTADNNNHSEDNVRNTHVGLIYYWDLLVGITWSVGGWRYE